MFEFEGLSPEEWADMMSNVNYNIPGQALTAAAVSSKFEDVNVTVSDDGNGDNATTNGTDSGSRRSDWPRTPVQLANYERVIEQRVGNAFADPKIFYSGKRHGPDDLAICVQLNVLAHHR